MAIKPAIMRPLSDYFAIAEKKDCLFCNRDATQEAYAEKVGIITTTYRCCDDPNSTEEVLEEKISLEWAMYRCCDDPNCAKEARRYADACFKKM